MNGHVGFESEPGRGSTFWVELPVHHAPKDQARRARPETRSEAAKIPAGPKQLVIYIEDNPSNIAFMQELLADFDHVTLLTAPTAEIGLPLVRARLPRAVIMDINLPGMSGVEAARKLAEWPETRSIPVIALSADVMMHDEKRVRDAVFHRYLTKPVKVDELSVVLEELLCRSA
jgi:CheY-like chemotaxis protein